MKQNRRHILIVEDEPAGAEAARFLEDMEFRGTRTTTAPSSPAMTAKHGLPRLTGLRGGFGSFDARIVSNGDAARREFSGVVAVQEPEPVPAFDLPGLEPGDRVVSLPDFRDVLAGLEPHADEHTPPPVAVFLMGVGHESRPASTREVLGYVSGLLDLGHRVLVLYGNLKVSGAGLEVGVREARRKGAVFLRLTQDSPRFSRDESGRRTVSLPDEAGRMLLTVQPDWTVVDTIRRPGPGASNRAALLGTEPGPDGFLPSDNVYRLGLETNRRGVLAVLPETHPLGLDSLEDDLAAVRLEMRALERFEHWAPEQTAVIDPRLCARCLTCHRSCPHGAVAVGERIEIMPEACFACGVCEAACPARAISLRQRGAGEAEAVPGPLHGVCVRAGDVVVLGCRRSAERARDLCRHLGQELPEGVVFVPVDCAGRISRRMLLDAFLSDASGVLVLTCHPGNCHAERGNVEARARVDAVRRSLEEIGLDPGRLGSATLAANMGVELGRTVRAFCERVRGAEEGRGQRT